MTHRERCLKFVEKHKDISTIIISREAGEELTDLYYRLTGIVVRCSGCVNEALVAYNSIHNYINRDSNPDHPFNKGKIMSNYKLKKDALVYCQSMFRHFNQSSITDELAVAAIAENENNLQYFEEYPEDFMKDVKAFLSAKSDENELKEQAALLQGDLEQSDDESDTPVHPEVFSKNRRKRR